MKAAFHKISVDFEYLNVIYDINSEPYNTLSELKEIISKKIFPSPGDVHCFYKNFDLYEKEDEEISKIFPNKTKIKITLKNPPTVKPLKKLKLNLNNQLKLNLFDSYPNIPTSVESSARLLRSKTIVQRNKLKFNSLPSTTIEKTETNQIIDKEVNENIKSNDFIYDLFHNSKKKLKKIKKDEYGIKNFMDKFKNIKMKNNKNISLSDKKLVNDLNVLLTNLKEKDLYSYKHNNINNIKLTSPKNLFLNKKADKIFKTQRNNLLNSNLQSLNLSIENKESNREKNLNEENNTIKTNNNNKEKIVDENYLCNSCKKETISEYCLICNEFKCNSCIELCKIDGHEHIEIKLDNDCFNIINSYGLLILSKINEKNEQIFQNDKELQIYDIKKFRDDFLLLINDILNIYNQIMNILENIYKENPIKKELDKFENDSNKIKIEINDIIKKANTYLKNDNQISKPKYKMMNIQYFFNSLNTKQKVYNTLTNKMQIYSLNSIINSNMKKCFNDIENSIKAFSNKNNPFELKDEAKLEYEKIINKFKTKKDKRRSYKKRNTISIKSANRLNLKKYSTEKNEDSYEDDYLDI